MTRDEIIIALQDKHFSFRFKFWHEMDEWCWREDASGKRFRVAWPWALTDISLDQWNSSWEATVRSFDFNRDLRKLAVSESKLPAEGK